MFSIAIAQWAQVLGKTGALARLRGRCYGEPVFGVGTWEMVVIAIVAMLLFKPSELPKMLRTVSRFWGQLRATADEFRETIMTADGMDELQDMVRGTQSQLRGIETDARKEMMKARAQMRRAQQKLALTQKARQERENPVAKAAQVAASTSSGPVASPATAAEPVANRPAAPPPPPTTPRPEAAPSVPEGDRNQGAA